MQTSVLSTHTKERPHLFNSTSFMHYKIHSYRQQNQEEVIKHFHIEIKQQKLTRGKYLILIKISPFDIELRGLGWWSE